MVHKNTKTDNFIYKKNYDKSAEAIILNRRIKKTVYIKIDQNVDFLLLKVK